MWKNNVRANPPPYHEVQNWSVDQVAGFFVQAGITPNKSIWQKHSVDGPKLLSLDQSVLLSWRGDLTISQVSQISVALKEMKDSQTTASRVPPRVAPKPTFPSRGPERNEFPRAPPTLPRNKPAFKPALDPPVKPKPSFVPVECDAYEVPNAIMSTTTSHTPKPNTFGSTGSPAAGTLANTAVAEHDDFTDDGSFTDDDELQDRHHGEIQMESDHRGDGEGECEYEVLDSNYKVTPPRLPGKPPALLPQNLPPAAPVDASKTNKVKLLPNFLSAMLKKNDKPSANGLAKPPPYRPDRTSSGSNSDSVSLASCGSALGEAESQPWFFSVERDEAERLLAKAKNGTFLIRPSVRAGPNKPYTLSIHYKGQVYHISIRKRPDGLLAPGFEKTNEMAFPTLSALVDNYTTCSLDVYRNAQLAGTTRLTQWPQ